ncbi:MAG: hypothetical protein MJB14_08060 [Spirochaetes bacterium]|nr:hypothetical protein [Spirochaetota bacterium]
MKSKIIINGLAIFIILNFVFLFGCNTPNSQNQQEDSIISSDQSLPLEIYVHQTLGDDNHPGTKSLPKETIQGAIDYIIENSNQGNVYVAQGIYEQDFQSAQLPVVVLSDKISLYGGYSAADWEIRDYQMYQTIIQDTSTTGGSISNPNCAFLGEDISTQTIIDGFIINGGGGDISFAVFNKDQSSPTITNCTIFGGSGVNSVAMYNFQSSHPVIQSCTIIGGDTETSFAIYNYKNSCPIIKANYIFGAIAGVQSLAIYNDTKSSAVIYNNYLDGGNADYSMGIFNCASSPVLRNNTINGGSNSISVSMGIANMADYDPDTGDYILTNPIIQNNILFILDGTSAYGIYEWDNDSDPKLLQNNNLHNCSDGLYYDSDQSIVLYTADDLNNFTLTTQNDTYLSSGNQSSDPMFVDIDGLDDNIVTYIDNNWQLSSLTPLTIAEGGLNGAHGFLNWGYTEDLRSISRSPLDNSSQMGWSMGAYEYSNTKINIQRAATTFSTNQKAAVLIQSPETSTNPTSMRLRD